MYKKVASNKKKNAEEEIVLSARSKTTS